MGGRERARGPGPEVPDPGPAGQEDKAPAARDSRDRIGSRGWLHHLGRSWAGRARQLLNAPKPKVPDWVGSQGARLSVTVTFTVGADGLVSKASVAVSSGYADVDAAVLAAIRSWRFTAVGSAEPLHGTIPYVIRAQ